MNRDLIATQLQLECIGLDADGLLVRIAGPDPDAIARFYLFLTADGQRRLFRADVPPAIRDRLRAIPTRTVFDDPATVKQILARHTPGGETCIGTTYVFPRPLPTDACPDVARLVEPVPARIHAFDVEIRPRPDRPIFAVVVEGRVVSACGSARESDEAGEAWVQTAPTFRRRGYARQAVAAWAQNLQKRGKTPFYSHRRENAASRAVARSLGLTKVFDCATFA